LDFNLFASRARGTVFIELFDDRPITRDNFLAYVNAGKYDGTLMHRLVGNFVLQGGGFEAEDDMYVSLPAPLYVALAPDRVDLDGNPGTQNPMIANERGNTPFRSNVTGTLAMAKQGGNPNSATSEFFFNLGNNGGANPDPAGPCSDNGLDCQNGGFTVFAQVVGDGMNLVNAFNAQLAAADLNFDTNGNGVHDSFFDPVENPNPDQGAFGTVPVLGTSYLDFDPLTLINADRIDYLGAGLTTTIPSGGLSFSTRDAFIDTGTAFTGTGELRVAAGRTLGVREGNVLAGRSLRNSGTLEPGLRLGSVTLQSFRQDAGAHLEIEIGGTTADSQYDRIAVTGGALLGGDLDVSLFNYNPQPGNSFTILTAALGIFEDFDNIILPQLSPGYVWGINRTATSITLTVSAGDYNRDGIVDVADYVMWRKLRNTTVTSQFALADGNGDMTINELDFTVWRQQIGNMRGSDSGAGGSSDVAVPEPAAAILLLAATPLIAAHRRRKTA
jgi:cyclophilin family peptidyl-prolyl cis-trans isomerase